MALGLGTCLLIHLDLDELPIPIRNRPVRKTVPLFEGHFMLDRPRRQALEIDTRSSPNVVLDLGGGHIVRAFGSAAETAAKGNEQGGWNEMLHDFVAR